MSFPRYPVYKDSGVEWLGEVPKGWMLMPIKHLATLNPNKPHLESQLDLLCTFVPMEKLKTGTISVDDVRPVVDVYAGYTYFEDGDVLQAKVTPCFENKNIAIAAKLKNGLGFGSTEINVLRARGRASSSYLYYRLQEDNYMRLCTASMIGAGGLKRVPGSTIENFKIAVPELSEQNQIARFLDHETSRIDALIEEQQRLIALLKEKSQAVISHAVTKGLDPTVPMKDSGVEWLGEVPAHWEVVRLKHIVSQRGGSTPSKENAEFWEGKIPWVTPKDMKRDVINDSIDHVSHEALSDTNLQLIPSNSILAVVRGMILAHSFPVAITTSEVTINQDMKALIGNKSLQPDYLLLLLQGLKDVVFEYVDSSAHGTKKIEWERFENIMIPLPDLSLQSKIISEVRDRTGSLDKLTAESRKALTLLQERRAALISAAVTGKIDVRGWEPPAENDTDGAASSSSSYKSSTPQERVHG